MNPWLFLGLCLAAVTAVLGLVFLWYQPRAQGLYPAAARAAIKTKQIHAVVDVRSEEEWRSGHYDGAFHIPLKQLVSRLPQTAPPLFCSTVALGAGPVRQQRPHRSSAIRQSIIWRAVTMRTWNLVIDSRHSRVPPYARRIGPTVE